MWGKFFLLFNLTFLARKYDNVIVVFCGTKWVSRFGWLQFFPMVYSRRNRRRSV